MNTPDQITSLIQRRLREIDSELRVLNKQKTRYTKMLDLTEGTTLGSVKRNGTSGWKTGAQKDVMAYLQAHPNDWYHGEELAQELQQEIGRVANAANFMARHGKIERRYEPGDRRALYRVTQSLDKPPQEG